MSGARNMTRGSIPGHLLSYCVPAILGDLFQVTYTAADAAIVGRFAGERALAAVSGAAPLTSIALFFIIGLGIGASVLMGEFYGAGEYRLLRREFSTSLFVAALASLGISLVLFLFARPLLALCRIPGEILPESAAYLRILACGLVFVSLYNMLAAAARSLGDARVPLLCLMAGSAANILLDLVLVAGLGLSVAGAAAATVFSQAVSLLLAAALLWRREGSLLFSREDFAPDRALLRRTLSFSYPGALQQAGIYVGKLAVQILVNPLGVSAVAAFGAVNRIDDYALIPERDISNAETVLVAQNRGAGLGSRMRAGLRTTLLFETVYGAAVSLAIFFGAAPLMRLFARAEDAEVVRLGTRYLRLMGLFYILPGVTNGTQGYLRALGKMRLTMAVTYAQMGTRAVITWLLIRHMGLDAVPLACLAGWTLIFFWEGALLRGSLRREKTPETAPEGGNAA